MQCQNPGCEACLDSKRIGRTEHVGAKSTTVVKKDCCMQSGGEEEEGAAETRREPVSRERGDYCNWSSIRIEEKQFN